MQPPFPAPVPEWHNDTYPSISPSNPSIASATAGKTVIVTGGGAGIGRGIAQAYAEAGATRVALLGRTEKTLNETKQIIEKDTKGAKVTVHIADVADEESVKRAAESIGGWDVLILNAGIAAKSGNLGEANIQDWWRVYETNVRGILVCTQAFLPTRKPSASILGINAGLIQIPSGIGPCAGQSAYSSSKVAQLRMLEFLAVEEPDIYVASVHPGVVDTHMSAEWSENIEYGKNGMPPLDNVKLPAHFCLWMTSPEAAFLRGRFVWCNWDVEQIKERKDDILKSQMLTSHDLGMTFKPQPMPGH